MLCSLTDLIAVVCENEVCRSVYRKRVGQGCGLVDSATFVGCNQCEMWSA